MNNKFNRNFIKLILIVFFLYLISCGLLDSTSTVELTAPSNLTYKKLKINSIQLNWTDNSNGEDGFKIDKKVDDENWNLSYGATDSNITQWTDENAEVNSNLQYRVYAYVGIDSSSSIETEFIDNTFPDPNNLEVEQLDLITPTCKLTWEDNSIGEEGFKIDRKIDDNEWVNELGLVDSNITIFTDDSIAIDYDIIYYRVYAYSGEYTSDKIEGNSNTVFPCPTNLVSESIAIDKIKLIWADNSSSEEGFKIDKKIEDSSWVVGYGATDSNITQWTDENAEINSKLQYRVYAYNSENISLSVETNMIDNIFPVPSNLVLSKLDVNKIKVSWDDNSTGEEGFYIDRKVGGLDWVTEYVTVSNNVSYFFDDIEQPCGTFYYRVRAYYGDSYSDYSNKDSTNIRLGIVGNFDTGGDASEIFISNETNWYSFIADKYNGLFIVDCVNPSSLEGKTYNEGSLPDRTLSVFATSKYAYVTTHTGIQSLGSLYIVDIDSLINVPPRDLSDSLTILGSCQTTGIPNDIFVKDNYAYIASGENGLLIIDISNPSLPFIVKSFSTGHFARKVFVENNYAYVTGGLDGLDIIDISSPNNPSLVSNFSTSGLVNDISVINNYVYVANGEEGLLILDISNPASPYEIASCQTEGFTYSLYAKEDVYQNYDFVYLVDKEKDVLVIDITDKTNPYILGSVEMTTNPISVSSFYYSSYMFLIDDEGLKVVQVAP
ncbi:MAG: hypothetical protein PF487_03380 [Bacteroidales bacterium]|jgi:hypothetical protein|nr:hypothetical protein [Bacteroidales bacterium]